MIENRASHIFTWKYPGQVIDCHFEEVISPSFNMSIPPHTHQRTLKSKLFNLKIFVKPNVNIDPF